MFLNFLHELRAAKIPVSMKEHLVLLEGMKAGLAAYKIETFYYLARTTRPKTVQVESGISFCVIF
jgi:uncharacterized protein